MKTLPGTNGAGNERSCRLLNSIIEGSRQPVVPPEAGTILLRHWPRAAIPSMWAPSGACSHTSPVLLSRTAPGKTVVKRDALGRFLSQFGVTPAKGSVGGAAVASLPWRRGSQSKCRARVRTEKYVIIPVCCSYAPPVGD